MPPLDQYHPWSQAIIWAAFRESALSTPPKGGWYEGGFDAARDAFYAERTAAVWPEVVPDAAMIWASTPWPEDKPPPDPQQSFTSSTHYRFLDDDKDLWEARI